MLYIWTGDGVGPDPPDTFNTGQDISDLLSSILRIDVDHESDGKGYSIPRDNPFINTPGARPEVWAYGLRNPWRMSVDLKTGDVWAADVGWELWEMVYRVERGGNYGWSIMEGSRQQIKPNGKRGPTPILPPTLSIRIRKQRPSQAAPFTAANACVICRELTSMATSRLAKFGRCGMTALASLLTRNWLIQLSRSSALAKIRTVNCASWTSMERCIGLCPIPPSDKLPCFREN